MEETGMLQSASTFARVGKHQSTSGFIDECTGLSTNASAPSQCPSGTIVNAGLKCIFNPSCPGITGCVESTGCQYVSTASLLQTQ